MSSIARTLRPAARAIKAASSSAGGYGRIQSRQFSARPASLVKKYTSEHEWIDLETPTSKTGTIGISTYAAHALGDVVYVELPTIDTDVAAGDSIGAVESVKSASDINSPVTCKVIEVNSLLEEKPGTINKASEDGGAGGGWVAKVELTGETEKELEKLMSEEEYKEFSSSE